MARTLDAAAQELLQDATAGAPGAAKEEYGLFGAHDVASPTRPTGGLNPLTINHTASAIS